MNRGLSYHHLADLELNEAAQYYDRESSGLGLAFLSAVERCTKEIVEYPEASPLLNDVVRRRLVWSFPYGVLYRVTPGEIRILAIMNLKRRPFYWIGRR